MANPEHLQILKQGVEAWNGWRKENPNVAPDLKDAELSNMNLAGIDFIYVNLKRADLSAANLSDGAMFRAANLHSANLRKTNLRDSFLTAANLSASDLSDADLSNASLFNADVSRAVLKRANLCGANLGIANLSHSDMSEANLELATFHSTALGDVNLTGAKGLDMCSHAGPSIIDHQTISKSGGLPLIFLRGCGLPESLITYYPSLLLDPIQFYSCFISYSSKDQEFVERLHADLQAKGVRCWFAPHDLPIGARIRPAIDESIRVHDKLLLVLSGHSVSSQWVEQEVETALSREREREGKTVLFPIRIDDSVMGIRSGWPALLKNTRNVGDFTRWKDHDSYQKALERLLRDLKTEEPAKPTCMTPDSLENRAVLSPRDTHLEGWRGVESSVIQAARRNRLVGEGERVDCGLLINQLHELGKISEATREDYFLLSKWSRSVAFDSFSSVEPQTAINFVNRASELQKALAVDTPPLP